LRRSFISWEWPRDGSLPRIWCAVSSTFLTGRSEDDHLPVLADVALGECEGEFVAVDLRADKPLPRDGAVAGRDDRRARRLAHALRQRYRTLRRNYEPGVEPLVQLMQIVVLSQIASSAHQTSIKYRLATSCATTQPPPKNAPPSPVLTAST
jgi:hypothetical protein